MQQSEVSKLSRASAKKKSKAGSAAAFFMDDLFGGVHGRATEVATQDRAVVQYDVARPVDAVYERGTDANSPSPQTSPEAATDGPDTAEAQARTIDDNRERSTSAELVTATMAEDFPDAAAISSTAEARTTVRPAAPCEGPESGDVGSDLPTADPRTAHAREVTEPMLEFEARIDREPTPASDADEKTLGAVDAHVAPVAFAAGQRDGDPDLLGDHVRTEAPRRTRRRLPWRPEGRRCSPEVEAEADRLAELIDAAPDGDDDPLTMVETVMRLDDVPLREIVTRGPLALADRLSKGLPHRHTGRHREITKPDEKARRVFYCLHRLKEQNPGDPLLPEIEDAKPYTKLSQVRLDLEAAAFKADVERWGVKSKQERGRETGDGRALDDVTRQSYARDVRSIYAAAVELRLVDASCSVATLGAPEVAEPVIAFLKTLYTPANVASMVAALARVAADLYGTDPGHTQAIDFLLAVAKRLFPDQELSDAAVARYANLTSDPLMMQTIFDAPRAMMARSDAPSLKPLDRFARASRAVAAQLKLDSVGLDAADAARLDFDEHFRRENGVLQMRLPDPRERGRFRWDPCTPEAEALIKEWLELKDREGIDGSLLFPSENDPKVPQMPRVAMAGVYDDFAHVTREYLTFDDIKTLRLYKALLKYPDKWRAIAEAACYKDPRSLARRLHIVLDRRRDGGAP